MQDSLNRSLSLLRHNSSFHTNHDSHQGTEGETPPNYTTTIDFTGRSLKSIRRIRQEQQDQDLLHRTLQDACEFAYGTKMVEVWVWDSITSKLQRPEGGWWIDPYWQSEDMSVFSQFVDTQRHDYIAPPALSPGVGVPGVLWSDLGSNRNRHSLHQSNGAHNRRRSNLSAGGGGSGVLDNTFLAQIFSDDHHFHNSASRIAWRDLKALANDPDQPYNKRLEVLASTDLRWTGGVPFSIQGQEGIVVYYARDNGTDLRKLQDPTNTAYLTTASDFVGSCLALRIPRRNALHRRQVQVDYNLRKVKQALLFLIRANVSLESIATGQLEWENKQPNHPLQSAAVGGGTADSNLLETTITSGGTCTKSALQFVQRKAKQSVTKYKGAANKAPPPFTWEMALFTSVGVLVSIFCVAALNDFLVAVAGPDYQMPMGPMGALLALQFGLTAAPAAQPRTILVGQVASMLIALALAELHLEKQVIQQSLSCAISIGVMAKIGVVNPPAAANAFLFASGSFGFGNMLMVLLGNLLAIVCSVVINNVSDNRQYPTSWGIPQIFLSKENFSKLMEGDSEDTVTLLLGRARRLRQLTTQLGSFGEGSWKRDSEQDEKKCECGKPAEPDPASMDQSQAPPTGQEEKHANNNGEPGIVDELDPNDSIRIAMNGTVSTSDEEMGGVQPQVRFSETTKKSQQTATRTTETTDPARPPAAGKHRRSPAARPNMFT